MKKKNLRRSEKREVETNKRCRKNRVNQNFGMSRRTSRARLNLAVSTDLIFFIF